LWIGSLQIFPEMTMVLDQNIDTSTSTGKLLFNVLASIAEFETEIRKERQMEGIAKAKAKGVRFGRKVKLSNNQVTEMRLKRQEGALIKELMSIFIPSRLDARPSSAFTPPAIRAFLWQAGRKKSVY
jgi:DNA invertase Pin-like site-specific DNA recombinase